MKREAFPRVCVEQEEMCHTLDTKKEDHVQTNLCITSTFMKMDVFSRSVLEHMRNVLYAQVRTPFGKDIPTHIFRNEDGSTCRRVSENKRRGSI